MNCPLELRYIPNLDFLASLDFFFAGDMSGTFGSTRIKFGIGGLAADLSTLAANYRGSL
jgi:hypothetical protein